MDVSLGPREGNGAAASFTFSSSFSSSSSSSNSLRSGSSRANEDANEDEKIEPLVIVPSGEMQARSCLHGKESSQTEVRVTTRANYFATNSRTYSSTALRQCRGGAPVSFSNFEVPRTVWTGRRAIQLFMSLILIAPTFVAFNGTPAR